MALRYSSNSMAVVLGLFNSMAAWVCLDAPCHMAEEILHPTKEIPKILYVLLISQFLVGFLYILVIGFSVTDIATIISTPTGYVSLQIVRCIHRKVNDFCSGFPF